MIVCAARGDQAVGGEPLEVASEHFAIVVQGRGAGDQSGVGVTRISLVGSRSRELNRSGTSIKAATTRSRA